MLWQTRYQRSGAEHCRGRDQIRHAVTTSRDTIHRISVERYAFTGKQSVVEVRRNDDEDKRNVTKYNQQRV